MPDPNYAGMDDMGESPPEPKSDTKPEDSEGATALIPKTLLGGKEFKVGEEVVLKIVHEYEDEVEVAYAKEPAKEKEPAGEPSADDEIDMMAAGGGNPSGGGY